MPDEAVGRGVSFLQESHNGDGGWGYHASEHSVVEATACALLALQASAQESSLCQSGLAWLLAAQNPDGGWGVAEDDRQSGWQTAWAILALAGAAAAGQALEKAAIWLAGDTPVRGSPPDPADPQQAIVRIDLSITGWPWLPKQSSWVEPTALAILASTALLRRAKAASAQANLQARVAEAVRYLQDRRCEHGGWNFGNPYMFIALPARAEPTGLAILALASTSAETVQSEDLAALRRETKADGGPLALALAVLALKAMGETAADELSLLLSLQQADGSWSGNCYHTALALLAIGGGLSL